MGGFPENLFLYDQADCYFNLLNPIIYWVLVDKM